MAHRKKDGRRRGGRSDDTEKGPDRVGYGCPPEETRFKPGQSGNPKGRPRRVPTLRAALEKVLGEHIGLREGERSQRVSKLDALVRTTMNRALKGDPRFLRAVLQMMQTGSGEDQGEVEVDNVVSADDEALLADYLARHGAEIAPSEEQIDQKTDEPSKPSNASKSMRGKP
jgi:hypothetical protein